MYTHEPPTLNMLSICAGSHITCPFIYSQNTAVSSLAPFRLRFGHCSRLHALINLICILLHSSQLIQTNRSEFTVFQKHVMKLQTLVSLANQTASSYSVLSISLFLPAQYVSFLLPPLIFSCSFQPCPHMHALSSLRLHVHKHEGYTSADNYPNFFVFCLCSVSLKLNLTCPPF